MFSRIILTLPVFIGNFFRFVFYTAFIGFAAFFLGQLLPRRNFDYTSFPFKCFHWENNGRIYLKTRIQFWKDKVPDMSQYIKSVFRKRITVFRSADYLEDLIRETCVAEWVHLMLVFISPIYLVLLDGAAGVLSMIAYALGNVPFILIQRYNRPRLIMVMERQKQLNSKRAAKENPKHILNTAVVTK